MKHIIQIKRSLGTFGIFCLAFTIQVFAEGIPANLTAAEQPAACATGQEELAKPDQTSIQGKWKPVAMRAGGNPCPPAIMAVMKYEFKGDQLIITPKEPGQTDYTFKLNPSSKPAATIDLTPVGSKKADYTMKGIYVLDGNHLKICLGKNKRPAEMRAEAEDGYGQVLIELERE